MAELMFPHTAHTVGRLVVTTTRQGGGAPVIDSACTTSVDGWRAGSVCVRLRRTPGRALVLGWIGRRPPPVHRLARFPVLGLLFRSRP